MRIKTIITLLGIVGLFSLAGCGSGNEADVRTPAAEQTTPSVTVTEEQTATPQELASVVAAYEQDWRDTVAGAGECRVEWVVADESDPTSLAKSLTCFTREKTIVLSTQIVARDLRELNPPASMQSIYDDTIATLDDVASSDLEGECGNGNAPADTSECSAVLGSLMHSYDELERILDSWAPYM